MDDYVSKPLQIKELSAAIERVRALSANSAVIYVDTPVDTPEPAVKNVDG